MDVAFGEKRAFRPFVCASGGAPVPFEKKRGDAFLVIGRRWLLVVLALVVAVGAARVYYYLGWERFEVTASVVRPAGSPCAPHFGVCLGVRLTNRSHRDAYTTCRVGATDPAGGHHDGVIMVKGSILVPARGSIPVTAMISGATKVTADWSFSVTCRPSSPLVA